ncbi:hypothetical protein [Variovorax sp. UMC13]|uniref:hypothetical protein n=1 Tax=Variovorax sp. UMC13 TaxID=1862326 RepID=UPI0015FF84E8|nr:hypothetical protein [Variovorax sp. UMC13]MBB1599227.1 hypothetical protein [Variovorax sp. UMC13]
MGFVLLTFVDLLSPLQSLASRWMPAQRARRSGGIDLHSDLHYVAVRPSCTAKNNDAPHTATAASRVARPLRVVRTVDAQQPGRRAGRLVISGRLADVCAELDRLAELEAAENMRPPHALH